MMNPIFTPFLLGTLAGGVLGVPGFSAPSSLRGRTTSGSPSNTSVLGSATSFPGLNDQSLLKGIEEIAHGTLSNAPPPPPGAIAPGTIGVLQLIEFNELFERSFYASLIQNITTQVSGFEVDGDESFVVEVLTAVLAQEDLHAINAKQALQSQNATTILPCEYKFPSSTYSEAIAFAATFTDLVLGTLQAAATAVGDDGNAFLLNGIVSIVGQEGEQEGFWRILQNKGLIPNELPFLTTSDPNFAFSALEQNVIVSCPNDDILKGKLSIFGVLNVDTSNIQPADQKLQFSVDLLSLEGSNLATSLGSNTYEMYGQSWGPETDYNQLSIVYINQQNLPIVAKVENANIQGTVVSFEAEFPYTENLLNALTIAALTTDSGPFTNASDVAAKTLFGPGLIEVN